MFMLITPAWFVVFDIHRKHRKRFRLFIILFSLVVVLYDCATMDCVKWNIPMVGYWLFGVMHLSVSLSVCLSVCLSVSFSTLLISVAISQHKHSFDTKNSSFFPSNSIDKLLSQYPYCNNRLSVPMQLKFVFLIKKKDAKKVRNWEEVQERNTNLDKTISLTFNVWKNSIANNYSINSGALIYSFSTGTALFTMVQGVPRINNKHH